MRASLFFLFPLCLFTLLSAQSRPNIIVIMTDDHAKNAVSIYGSRINSTPNIDRIGREGALFTRAFVTNSICGPSRAVHLTGTYSHINGTTDHSSVKFNGGQWTYPQALRQAGYHTALIGKWHLGSIPTGFDYFSALVDQGEYYNPRFIQSSGDTIRMQGYTTELINELAIRVIDSIRSQPFCILIHQKAPHRNWMPSPKYFALYDSADVPMPENFFDDHAGRSRAAAEQDMEVRNMYLSYDLKLFLEEGEAEPGSGGSEKFKLQAKAAWDRDLKRLTREQREAWDRYYRPISDAFYKNRPTGTELEAWKYQRYIKDYLRCIASVDDNIGQLLDHLQERGILDSTVVIYTSDQGFFLGEHGWYDKRFMYEESIGIPFLVRYPPLIVPGTVRNELVMNLDVAPTMMALAGLPIPDSLQGRSMLPLFTGSGDWNWRTSVYYHYYEYPHGWHKVKRHLGVRTERYVLIHFYNDIDEWELYDLWTDPQQMHNRADDPALADIRISLEQELERLRSQYRDTGPDPR